MLSFSGLHISETKQKCWFWIPFPKHSLHRMTQIMILHMIFLKTVMVMLKQMSGTREEMKARLQCIISQGLILTSVEIHLRLTSLGQCLLKNSLALFWQRRTATVSSTFREERTAHCKPILLSVICVLCFVRSWRVVLCLVTYYITTATV